MQEQSQTLSNSTQPGLRLLPTKDITGTLQSMDICNEADGYWVELERASNVRTVVSIIHKFTDLKFETSKKDRGIMVWRKA